MAGIWEQRSIAVIAEAAKSYEGETLDGLRAHINKAYPFGERARYPYRIWIRTLKRYMAERKAIERLGGFTQPKLRGGK